MESFAGADLHKRVTQLAVLRDGQPPSQFRFSNDPKTVHGVLRKLPRGDKDRGRGHGFVVVVCREGKRTGTRGLPFSRAFKRKCGGRFLIGNHKFTNIHRSRV